MSNTFFTSDTHFHHKNIIRGISDWKEPHQKTRPYTSFEEHDAKLVENINAVVKGKDILYHLGDWSFGGIERIWEFRKQLNCRTIHLILGNHDHHIENDKKGIIIPLTEWGTAKDIMGDFGVGISTRMLFSSVHQTLLKDINGKRIFLSHYSHRVWPKANHGVWHLYGHSHGTLPDYQQNWNEEFQCSNNGIIWVPAKKYKCMDVGVDTHPEFRPYSFDEIAEIMKDRIDLGVDHHNENNTQ